MYSLIPISQSINQQMNTLKTAFFRHTKTKMVVNEKCLIHDN